MRWRIVGLAAAGVLVAACGPHKTTEITGSPTAASITPSTSPSPAFIPPQTALAVVKALHRLDHRVKVSVTYHARTDPNHLLGRPEGYKSKTAFTDTHINQAQFTARDRGGVDPGGSVEYFRSEHLAIDRAKYIQRLQAGSALFGTEYDYVDEGVLLRVSGHLVPKQAKRVKHELGRLMRHPARGPVTA